MLDFITSVKETRDNDSGLHESGVTGSRVIFFFVFNEDEYIKYLVNKVITMSI